MLRYFLEKNTIEPVNNICDALNRTKHRIENGEFADSHSEYDACTKSFESVLKIAIDTEDEELANAQYVFQQYFLLFCNLIKYFDLLKRKEYKLSWIKLQDCIDAAQYIGRFADERLDVPPILDLLRSYESLYPYTVFASSEYIITRSHCSLCGKSMQSLECSHIKGNLYWGKSAVEVIDEIKEFQAVCLVSHPEDKRCIIELSDDNRDEADRFKKLDQFLELNISFLQNFSVKSIMETRMKELKKAGRNDPCPCGSGTKFKKCCGRDLYYQHERNLVTTKKKITLAYL